MSALKRGSKKLLDGILHIKFKEQLPIQDFPQNFKKLSKKKGKLLKIVITLKEKAVKSKALRVNRKV